MKNISKLLFVLPLIATPLSVQAVSFTFGGHTYETTSTAESWTQAEAEAVGLGGHLVSINSAAEQAFLVSTFLADPSFANVPLWIGLNDITNGGGVGSKIYTTWTTGEPVTYTNWNPGEPNNFPPGEDYGTINWHHAVGGAIGTWNDTPVNGTVGLGGNTNGPYFGIIEIPGKTSVPESGSTAMFLSLSLTAMTVFHRKLKGPQPAKGNERKNQLC